MSDLIKSKTGPGIYATTDPNVRIVVKQDDENPADLWMDADVFEEMIRYHKAGEVYGVIVERRGIWENIQTKERTVHWTKQASIWACVGYEDVAAEVAKEFFALTVTGPWEPSMDAGIL